MSVCNICAMCNCRSGALATACTRMVYDLLILTPSTFASSILMNSVVKDTWLPEWTEDAEVACQRWANDSSWGALRKGPRHAKCGLNRLSAFFSLNIVFLVVRLSPHGLSCERMWQNRFALSSSLWHMVLYSWHFLDPNRITHSPKLWKWKMAVFKR